MGRIIKLVIFDGLFFGFHFLVERKFALTNFEMATWSFRWWIKFPHWGECLYTLNAILRLAAKFIAADNFTNSVSGILPSVRDAHILGIGRISDFNFTFQMLN